MKVQKENWITYMDIQSKFEQDGNGSGRRGKQEVQWANHKAINQICQYNWPEKKRKFLPIVGVLHTRRLKRLGLKFGKNHNYKLHNG